MLSIVTSLLLLGGAGLPAQGAEARSAPAPTAPVGPDLDAPAAVTQAGGPVDLFTGGVTTSRLIPSRATVQHRVRTKYGWSAGEPITGAVYSAPAAASSAAGTLQVFAKSGTGKLMERISSAPGTWSGWISLGGAIIGRPAASSPGARRLDVFAQGRDGALWSRSGDSAGQWSAWFSLGGRLAVDSGPAAVSTGGTTTVVVRQTDDALWSRTRAATGQWSAWTSLGGNTLSDPAVASSAPGRLDVYQRGTDDALWYRAAGAVSSAWQSLGGTLVSGPAASAPPAGGAITVVALGPGATYVTGRHTLTSSPAWSGWQRLPNITRPSWNSHVPCLATLTTIEGVLGSQTNTSGGATMAGGGFAPGIPVKNSATPPCLYNGMWEYVEIDNVRLRLRFNDGNSGDGDHVGWMADPTQPLGPMTQLHGEISQAFIAAGFAPTNPPEDTLIDIQGFVYWDPSHVNEDWHMYTGWEIHPLTAWRYAR